MKKKIDLRKCKVVAWGIYKWIAPKKHSGTCACDLVLIENGIERIYRPICVKGDEIRFRVVGLGRF